MNLYVSNLGFNVSDDDLRSLFAEYGTVSSAKVITDKMTQQSRGFGFVEMNDDSQAITAIAKLNGSTQDGRALRVSEAKPREERQDNRFSSKKW